MQWRKKMKMVFESGRYGGLRTTGTWTRSVKARERNERMSDQCDVDVEIL